MKKIALILIFVFTAGSLPAQEFFVNTYKDSTQRDPQIACDGQGNFVVVWNSDYQVSPQDEGEILLQRFDASLNKVGNEEFVNTITADDQERPALAENADGDFIIAWASKTSFESIYDIKARLYKNGEPAGDEFLVNQTTQYSQTNPEVAIDNDGNFVIVWDSWFQDGSDKGVYARVYKADGTPLTSEFRVNTTTQYSQTLPVVKYFPNNNFVVLWQSWKQDVATPKGYGLYGKIYNSKGEALTDEFQVNTYTNDYQWYVDVLTLPSNNFVAAWCSWTEDGDQGGIYLQKFNSSGEKICNEVLVNNTTVKYQWLPRLALTRKGNIAVAWSSWQQDGSREGVYLRYFSPDLNPISFETQVNDYTDSFQWEPDLIPYGENDVLVVWSTWGKVQPNYEVVGKVMSVPPVEGVINTHSYRHIAGRTTGRIFVHVIDSTKLTGDKYKVTFDVSSENYLATITNENTSAVPVKDFPLNNGEGVFYLTDEFDGLAVEFKPEFDLSIDYGRSYFANHSGSNLNITIGPPSGVQVIAPIDVEVIFGSPDTLSDGTYSTPLDTAYNTTGQRVVVLPFYVWNKTDGKKMQCFIPEVTKNNKWDPDENVIVMTPTEYQKNFPNFHVQLNLLPSGANVQLPTVGDTIFIFTNRPLTSDDVFEFEGKTSLISTGMRDNLNKPEDFRLNQNYPNPFGKTTPSGNPTTTISYVVPSVETRHALSLRLIVYDVLGREVATLVNKPQAPGVHKVLFNASHLSSGVYFYTLFYEGKSITKKMILLK